MCAEELALENGPDRRKHSKDSLGTDERDWIFEIHVSVFAELSL